MMILKSSSEVVEVYRSKIFGNFGGNLSKGSSRVLDAWHVKPNALPNVRATGTAITFPTWIYLKKNSREIDLQTNTSSVYNLQDMMLRTSMKACLYLWKISNIWTQYINSQYIGYFSNEMTNKLKFSLLLTMNKK